MQIQRQIEQSLVGVLVIGSLLVGFSVSANSSVITQSSPSLVDPLAVRIHAEVTRPLVQGLNIVVSEKQSQQARTCKVDLETGIKKAEDVARMTLESSEADFNSAIRSARIKFRNESSSTTGVIQRSARTTFNAELKMARAMKNSIGQSSFRDLETSKLGLLQAYKNCKSSILK